MLRRASGSVGILCDSKYFNSIYRHICIHSLRAYKIIQGTRGQKGVNEDKFAEIIVRLSTLLRFATEIKEMDINPLLATEKAVVAVDARIRIEK